MVATVISLDGIPGAGKSRLLRDLETKLTNVTGKKIICLQEPVEEWSKLKDRNDNTLFYLYYNNQKRYALAFQLQVLHTRFELLEQTVCNNPDSLILTERDITSDYKIFTQMLYDSGMFEEIEFKLYQQLYESYHSRLEQLCSSQHNRIYLKTSAEKAYTRMKLRGREEEKNVTLEYLDKVEKYHEKAFGCSSNVLEINGNEDWDVLPDVNFNAILSYLER